MVSVFKVQSYRMGKLQYDHIVTGVITLIGGVACLLLSMREGRKFTTVLGYTILAAAIAVTSAPVLESKWGIPNALTICAIGGFGFLWIPLVEKELPKLLLDFIKQKSGLSDTEHSDHAEHSEHAKPLETEERRNNAN